MIELTTPELQTQELALESIDPSRGEDGTVGGPADRDVPILGSTAPSPLRGRVFVGGPLARRITPAVVADDLELSAFIDRQSPHFDYHLVHLSVTFQPGAPKLNKAVLDLRLTALNGPGEPIALSMTPRRLVDARQVQRTLRLGPQLTFMEVEATLGEYQRSSTAPSQKVFLEALRPLRSDPSWEFRRTPAMSLTGSHDLALVVRAPAGAPTAVSLTVSAATKANLVRWYRSTLPDPLRLDAVL